MGLLRTIMSQSGKRKLGWVVKTDDLGVCLVVKRTPLKIAVSTSKSKYKSINESAAQDQAGWSLEEPLLRAIRSYDIEHVVVYVPKPGVVYTTPASNYHAKGVMYMVSKNKSGDRVRCVGMQHFQSRPFNVKL